VTEPQSGDESPVGRRFELEIGPVAHGGHFVARHEGQVVFVRHALPGETVTVEITETAPSGRGGRFLRGDAVEVHTPSPERVSPPCPYAGPGACGGCDFQHVTLDEQRRLKAAVVEEQLSRLAGIERDVTVEAVPPHDGLGWRSRMQYVHPPGGGLALRKHRSHDLVPIDRCLIAHPDAREPEPRTTVVEHVDTGHGSRDLEVAADGFWQPHVAAPRTLVDCVLDLVRPRAGESVLDLYAGVGLFASFLAEAVGPTGSVVAVEGDRRAARHAKANLAGCSWARSITGRVDRVLSRGVSDTDVVVLDPPRTGAKRQVVRAIAGLAPRAVAYVACDPAALARDVGYFAEFGYDLAALRVFDLFPMTHHIESVALLVPEERSS
jgi:tRNA/tmRNA/rRNA uracil-C5-methylase (TrmA/RlmC/RlmD family)